MKVFFSYASEDSRVVEEVYKRFTTRFPDIEIWVDKYKIVAGDDLIEKIIDGIDNADKFLIFLSSQSIKKQWVKKELRKAMMKELNKVNPEFIIPIKLGIITSFPAFLETKRYIDLENKTEDEWLQEMYSAIMGDPLRPDDEITENLQINIVPAQDTAKAIFFVFTTRF